MHPQSFHERFSTSAEGQEKKRGRWVPGWVPRSENGILEALILLVVAYDLIFGLIRPFVVEPMHVPSESMSPTLQTRDRVLTNKLAYDLTGPERGDLVVFESLGTGKKIEDVVKRVVGLPGDEVSMQNGTLLVNGDPYEPRADAESHPARNPRASSFGPVTVPEAHVFVMGDNRENSYDSRFFGPVPTESLVGQVSLRFWPPSRLGSPS